MCAPACSTYSAGPKASGHLVVVEVQVDVVMVVLVVVVRVALVDVVVFVVVVAEVVVKLVELVVLVVLNVVVVVVVVVLCVLLVVLVVAVVVLVEVVRVLVVDTLAPSLASNACLPLIKAVVVVKCEGTSAASEPARPLPSSWPSSSGWVMRIEATCGQCTSTWWVKTPFSPSMFAPAMVPATITTRRRPKRQTPFSKSLGPSLSSCRSKW
mmetsp:Transcript_98214/g.219823  ORF Transcript_98214/g.219823 Transcript_98214/m.219823 type:complete len:211 (-) Transcript_98214:170-802(-)